MERKLPKITNQFNKRLLLMLLIIFLLATVISILLQYNRAVSEADRLLHIAIDDKINDISCGVDETLKIGSDILKTNLEIDAGSDLNEQQELFFTSEISILDENSIITDSTDKSRIGLDLKRDPFYADFLSELQNKGEAVLHMEPDISDPEAVYEYICLPLEQGGHVMVGYSVAAVESSINDIISLAGSNHHVLEHGLMFILSGDDTIVSKHTEGNEKNIRGLTNGMKEAGGPDEIQRFEYVELPFYRMYGNIINYTVVAVIPEYEVFDNAKISIILIIVLGGVLILSLFFNVSALAKKYVVRQVNEIAQALSDISGGNLDAKVNVHSSAEFDTISKGINATVSSLKEHIAREAARIDEELTYAKEIQLSALPALTKRFSDDPHFSLFASMDTAKEVGGDFYDFYMTNEHTLFFMIADVSGKGIPAAMFMMNGKATLHDSVMRSDDPGESITGANGSICENNKAGMFITAWVGMLDLDTGEVRFVNAGHNPPVLIHDGKASFPEMEADLILGLMDDEEYHTQTVQMKKGDILFLYTDGVTEAVDKDRDLYGEERLIDALSGTVPDSGDICRSVCRTVTDSVKGFAGSAPQADDITMLCLYYKGGE